MRGSAEYLTEEPNAPIYLLIEMGNAIAIASERLCAGIAGPDAGITMFSPPWVTGLR